MLYNKIFKPARCTSKQPDILDSDNFSAELKLDGSRYVLYLGCSPYSEEKQNVLLSRRLSTVDYTKLEDGSKVFKYTDRSDNIPHITHLTYKGLDGTVLDGECFRDDFETTTAIMSSEPLKAIERQKNGWVSEDRHHSYGNIIYYVWDIMAYKGQDITNMPLIRRRELLTEVVAKMSNPYVRIIPIFDVANLQTVFRDVVDSGGEGLIIKDLNKGYGLGWSKMKKSYDVSLVISGFKPGKGKYANQVGALEISVYVDGKLQPVGYCSGFDDNLRKEITLNKDKYLNKVVDVFTQEISKPTKQNMYGRLRHPTFHRFREDINMCECTYDKLLKDIKKQPKQLRIKEVI